jgi:hypothetical protein
MAEAKRMTADVLIIVVALTLVIVAGLWMTGKGIDDRIDAVDQKIGVVDNHSKAVMDRLEQIDKAINERCKASGAPAAPAAVPTAPATPEKKAN